MHRTPFKRLRQKFAIELEDILECPICLGQYEGFVIQCLSGHGICKDCFTQLREKICPLCKQKYYGTRNYLAQDLVNKFEEIKISLIDPENSINRTIVKDKMSIGTQTSPRATNNKASAIANQPAAESAAEINRPLTRQLLRSMFNQKENKVPNQIEDSNVIQSTANCIVTLKPGSGQFPCLIGMCSKQLSHRLMVPHLREHHAKFFINAGIVEGCEYTRKWKIQYEPRIFDQAIHIENMGIFFTKILIGKEGDVHGSHVQLNNTAEIAKHFKYSLSIGKDDTYISFESRVQASRVVSKSAPTGLFISETNVKDIMKKKQSLDCVLKITYSGYKM